MCKFLDKDFKDIADLIDYVENISQYNEDREKLLKLFEIDGKEPLIVGFEAYPLTKEFIRVYANMENPDLCDYNSEGLDFKRYLSMNFKV